jgi:predicted GNAT superfamily acetyltransferase
MTQVRGATVVEIRELTGSGELHSASALLASIWPPTDPMPFEMLRVARHIGGYVSGAFDGETMIGAAAGFPTADGGLHSHILGVTPAARNRHIGFSVKLHQRIWALDHGMTRISWTFDPLTRRNAYFNLAKLAARAPFYLEDFYGDMPDELNAGDPSDRLLVVWHLNDPEVAKAVAGEPRLLTEPDQTVLAETPNGDPRLSPLASGQVGVATPADISALRLRQPEMAAGWRRAQRDAFAGILASGYEITGFTPAGCYVLEPVHLQSGR